jgi:hypothetical protein
MTRAARLFPAILGGTGVGALLVLRFDAGTAMMLLCQRSASVSFEYGSDGEARSIIRS